MCVVVKCFAIVLAFSDKLRRRLRMESSSEKKKKPPIHSLFGSPLTLSDFYFNRRLTSSQQQYVWHTIAIAIVFWLLLGDKSETFAALPLQFSLFRLVSRGFSFIFAMRHNHTGNTLNSFSLLSAHEIMFRYSRHMKIYIAVVRETESSWESKNCTAISSDDSSDSNLMLDIFSALNTMGC